MQNLTTRCFDIFLACKAAIQNGDLIKKVSEKDKEYHFQNWFEQRLAAVNIDFDDAGRNSYPDYTLVTHPEGYELKALAYPGREATFDSNSQVPTGKHKGRTVFYVFGRYPTEVAKAEREYPLIDLVLCHGDFLNADHTYLHKNRSFRGFGSYGDLMVRDRKMYVAPTPFALLEGVTSLPTLIIPADYTPDRRFQQVGRFTRVEVDQLVVGYEFDLKTNQIQAKYAPNPSAGKAHEFIAYRPTGDSRKQVKLMSPVLPLAEGSDDE
ncbi:hypothetical protein [Comamonas sp. JC664]|uniref:hypothetical protein n=1 Tax=Comamonas sp. JC664 TaxID=2801917 RepID=UPI00174EC6E4|nr:hypothetical protein [Comamonas sp. JC664]MBL0693098.1 hypothetical protein [Comamonas sp. JC664]GHH04689.1 hypothetical protein GCM10012319_74230 [Comamonas sp. KCTC 72670]